MLVDNQEPAGDDVVFGIGIADSQYALRTRKLIKLITELRAIGYASLPITLNIYIFIALIQCRSAL